MKNRILLPLCLLLGACGTKDSYMTPSYFAETFTFEYLRDDEYLTQSEKTCMTVLGNYACSPRLEYSILAEEDLNLQVYQFDKESLLMYVNHMDYTDPDTYLDQLKGYDAEQYAPVNGEEVVEYQGAQDIQVDGYSGFRSSAYKTNNAPEFADITHSFYFENIWIVGPQDVFVNIILSVPNDIRHEKWLQKYCDHILSTFRWTIQ